MNNKEFIAVLAQRSGYSTRQTQRLVNRMLNRMGDCFQEGDSVQIVNFGTFDVKKKLEKILVNPGSGQRMLVPPKLVLGFKPNSEWKNNMKKGGTAE